MAALLVEADLLLGRQDVGVGPVALQVVEPDQEVDPAVAVPVDRDDLGDPARPEAEVGGQAQRLAGAEARAVGLALVPEQDQPLGAEGDQVEPAGRRRWASGRGSGAPSSPSTGVPAS